MANRREGRAVREEELRDWHSLIGEPEVLRQNRPAGTLTGLATDRRRGRHPRVREIRDWELWTENGALPHAAAGGEEAGPPEALARPAAIRRTAAKTALVKQCPEPKILRRLNSGKIKPERRADLHGMTVSEAKEELSRFFAAAAGSGAGLLLVITGKGRGSRSEFGASGGVLNRMLPQWLTTGPHADKVLHYCHAHPRHGGSGAYYVLLRRPDRRMKVQSR